jgi:hypothetical protein
MQPTRPIHSRASVFATVWVAKLKRGPFSQRREEWATLQQEADVLELSGDGLTVIAYTAPADSTAQQQLDFLANWSSTTTTSRPTQGEQTSRPSATPTHPHPDR